MDPTKAIDDEIKDLRDNEIPEIDIEMAIQRKYPEMESEVVPHDGEPGISDKEATDDPQVPPDAPYEEWEHNGMFCVRLPGGNEQCFESSERRDRYVNWYQAYILEHGTPPVRVKRQAIVVKEKGKWKVKTEDGSRTLGTHDNAQDAHKQLYAIEMSKKRSKKSQKVSRCMDTQGNYGMPCPHPAKYECYHHKVKQGKVFPICSNHAYIAGIQQHVEPVQKIVNCHECQLATTFGEDKDMYGGGTNMDAFPKGGRLTVMQTIKLEKLAQSADWIQKQRLEEVRQRLKEQKSAPKQEVSNKSDFDIADDLFYKEFYGAASSGDAGMKFGYERIPIAIYSKLMRPGIETKRKGPKWDTLTPQEFETALGAMSEAAEKAKMRALMHSNRKPDGPVNRKKP